MKVVIAGGSGQVGQILARRMVARGDELAAELQIAILLRQKVLRHAIQQRPAVGLFADRQKREDFTDAAEVQLLPRHRVQGMDGGFQ